MVDMTEGNGWDQHQKLVLVGLEHLRTSQIALHEKVDGLHVDVATLSAQCKSEATQIPVMTAQLREHAHCITTLEAQAETSGKKLWAAIVAAAGAVAMALVQFFKT